MKRIVGLLEKRHKQHIRRTDPDGFFQCPEQDIKHFSVATKKEWLGTEQARREAIKQFKHDRKLVRCEFCQLYRELKEAFSA